MDHVVILNKKFKALQNILAGNKTIESRWLKNRSAPYNKVKPKDILYFKESSKPLTHKARVTKVHYFDLHHTSPQYIIDKYNTKICLQDTNWKNREKRYCVLIEFDSVKKIQPFYIDKTGFGNAAAWLVVKDITKIIIH